MAKVKLCVKNMNIPESDRILLKQDQRATVLEDSPLYTIVEVDQSDVAFFQRRYKALGSLDE